MKIKRKSSTHIVLTNTQTNKETNWRCWKDPTLFATLRRGVITENETDGLSIHTPVWRHFCTSWWHARRRVVRPACILSFSVNARTVRSTQRLDVVRRTTVGIAANIHKPREFTRQFWPATAIHVNSSSLSVIDTLHLITRRPVRAPEL